MKIRMRDEIGLSKTITEKKRRSQFSVKFFFHVLRIASRGVTLKRLCFRGLLCFVFVLCYSSVTSPYERQRSMSMYTFI